VFLFYCFLGGFWTLNSAELRSTSGRTYVQISKSEFSKIIRWFVLPHGRTPRPLELYRALVKWWEKNGGCETHGWMMVKHGVSPWWNMVLFGICVLWRMASFLPKKGGKTNGISPAPVIFTTRGSCDGRCKSSQTNLKSGQLGKLGMISHHNLDQGLTNIYYNQIRTWICRNGLRWIPIH
jgi:hypothetical protein